MVDFIYTESVPSEIRLVCKSVAYIIDQLHNRADLSEDQLMDVRLILSELMINGCEHGNGNNPDKLISVQVAVDEKRITFDVKDEGRGFVFDLANYDPHCLDSSGRGLKIVSSLCDMMSVQENRVVCVLSRHRD